MPEAIEMSLQLPASPQQVYEAWLDARIHTAFTGSPASTSTEPGAAFTAWDGYISGRNLELEPHRRILQSWRTSEFRDSDPDSHLEILIEARAGGATLTLKHSNLPDGSSAEYRQGWLDYYFEPLSAYFAADV
ncbi:MAG: SRPBCC domain-containing protein [Anaerolineales bacterium]|nr:SRPBCC domain-containing protein [Anaerolineales bacterium]